MKTKTKQTTRTGTESEKWTSQGGISVGRGKGGKGGERYREEEARLDVQLMDVNYRVECWRVAVARQRGLEGEKLGKL